MSSGAGRLVHGVKHVLPHVLAASSRGSTVFTECGRTLLDFTCGIGVTNLGHCHPGVTAAAQAACGQLVHCAQNIMRHRPLVDLIAKLTELRVSRKSGLDSWFFWNSGSEAVEAAVKLARMATGKQNIIAMNLGYHGRTFLAMSLTSSGTIYRSGFGPLPPGVHVAPFPYVSRGPYAVEALAGRATASASGQAFSLTHGHCEPHGCVGSGAAERDAHRCLEAVELMLRTQTSPSETAAILLEPVLGEGGYVPAPPGFIAGLRKLCDKHGMLLIMDEVQTGFGRTGELFASEWVDGGCVPIDILIMAKGLGNGFPISAIGTRSDLSAHQPPGSMGGTYGGNGVAVAAALAVLRAFESEGVLENVAERAVQIRGLLSAFDKAHPGVIRDVRGRGLMIGVELEPASSGVGTLAPRVVAECHERNLLVLSCGPWDTIRLIPALNVSAEDAARGTKLFLEGLLAARK